jgi:acyl-coenzyme A synthetase/AMP-(fatty) acid ligase
MHRFDSRRIHVVPSTPRNALGKVERIALAALTGKTDRKN